MLNKKSNCCDCVKTFLKYSFGCIVLFVLIFGVIELVNIVTPFSRNPLVFEIVLSVLFFAIAILLFYLSHIITKRNTLIALSQNMSQDKSIEEFKERFISILNHKIRTKLTSIAGSLKIITNGLVGEVPLTMKEMIKMANENAQELSNEIDKLLDIDNYSQDV